MAMRLKVRFEVVGKIESLEARKLGSFMEAPTGVTSGIGVLLIDNLKNHGESGKTVQSTSAPSSHCTTQPNLFPSPVQNISSVLLLYLLLSFCPYPICTRISSGCRTWTCTVHILQRITSSRQLSHYVPIFSRL